MSGPHHYFGWIDPRKYHTLEFNINNTFPLYREYREYKPIKISKPLIPSTSIVLIEDYKWHCGNKMSNEIKEKFQRNYGLGGNQYTYMNKNKMIIEDSLFESPGILEMNRERIIFPVINDGYNYDLSPFRAQIVPNNEPFTFNQELIDKYEHAQHKLRVVTYNYGNNYVRDYLMEGSGIFIERHDFIQAITPVDNNCGGYVILGRELKTHKSSQLELIAVTIPFGYTLLVDVGAIHGDSTLTGLYMMAMTGNHNAMKTADTVFMKHVSGKNVKCITEPILPSGLVPTLSGNNFLLTSDKLSLHKLKDLDTKEKVNITSSLGIIQKMYWQSVILTGTPNIGWKKTLGQSLPI
jgi:hypothetical protein